MTINQFSDPASQALLDARRRRWHVVHGTAVAPRIDVLDITDYLTLSRLFQTECPPYALVNVDMHEPVSRMRYSMRSRRSRRCQPRPDARG